MTDQIHDILSKARALVDAVAFDDNGKVIGTHLVGGNGGLLSRETIKTADALRLALSACDQAANLPASPSANLQKVETEAVLP